MGHNLAMTEDTPHAPEGWYPDPEDDRYLRWWNGYQWELRRPAPKPGEKPVPKPGAGPTLAPAVPVGRAFSRLATAVGVLLAFGMLVLVGQLALSVWGRSMIDDAVATGDIGKLETYDGLDLTLSVLLVLCVLSAGICWMVWQYQLARAARPGELKRGPGMHAFSWIIPVAAAWLPYQNVKDLWRHNAPGRSLAILRFWWAGWLVGQVLDRVVAGSYGTADTVTEFQNLVVLEAVTTAVGLATAVLALRIVRTLTSAGLAHSVRHPAESGAVS